MPHRPRQEAEFLAAVDRETDPDAKARLQVGSGVLRIAIEHVEGRAIDARSVLVTLMPIPGSGPFSQHREHRRALRAVIRAAAQGGRRRDLHAALVDYGTQLALEDLRACALAILSLSERLWDDTCSPEAALHALVQYAMLQIRHTPSYPLFDELPLLIATRARRAKLPAFVARARLVKAEMLMQRGLIKEGLRHGMKVFLSATGDHGDIGCETYLLLAAGEEMRGHHRDAFGYANLALTCARGRLPLHQNGLLLLGATLVELGVWENATTAEALAHHEQQTPAQRVALSLEVRAALETRLWARLGAVTLHGGRGLMGILLQMRNCALYARRQISAGQHAQAEQALALGRALAHTWKLNDDHLHLEPQLTQWRQTVRDGLEGVLPELSEGRVSLEERSDSLRETVGPPVERRR